MLDKNALLELSDRFMAVTGLPETTVSHRVFGDTKKLSALRNGADLTTRRFNGALAWFQSNWPEGAVFPADLARPGLRPDAACAPSTMDAA